MHSRFSIHFSIVLLLRSIIARIAVPTGGYGEARAVGNDIGGLGNICSKNFPYMQRMSAN